MATPAISSPSVARRSACAMRRGFLCGQLNQRKSPKHLSFHLRVMNTTGSDTEFNGAVTTWKLISSATCSVPCSSVSSTGLRTEYCRTTWSKAALPVHGVVASDNFCCWVHGGYITLAVNAMTPSAAFSIIRSLSVRVSRVPGRGY